MARVEKNVLGMINGRVGDLVFKVRNGKQYVASRPSKYTMSRKPTEEARRNKFSVNGKFAKCISSVPELKAVWEKAKAPAVSGYNKICSVNFKRCSDESPTLNNIITPGGFPLDIKKIEAFEDKIAAELFPFGLLDGEEKVVFVMIVCFYMPAGSRNEFYELRALAGINVSWPVITFNYNHEEKIIARKYENKIAWLAAVTEDKNGKVVRCSESVGRELG